jgi:hypothetical protein
MKGVTIAMISKRFKGLISNLSKERQGLTIVELCLGIMISILCLAILWGSARLVHQTFFPVITDVEVKDVFVLRDGYRVDIEFTKRDRFNLCEFQGVQTFIGERDGRASAVKNEFALSVGSRPNGRYLIESWKIITKEPFDNVYADAIHKCNPFYLVRSPFVH